MAHSIWPGYLCPGRPNDGLELIHQSCHVGASIDVVRARVCSSRPVGERANVLLHTLKHGPVGHEVLDLGLTHKMVHVCLDSRVEHLDGHVPPHAATVLVAHRDRSKLVIECVEVCGHGLPPKDTHDGHGHILGLVGRA